MSKTRFGSLDGIHQIKKKNFASTALVSAVLFVLIFIGFLFAVSKATEGSVSEQRQSLSDAIDRAVIQCYVTEGRYPESFEYLKENLYFTHTKICTACIYNTAFTLKLLKET